MPTLPTILFVDDEPSILAALRRMLHGVSAEWCLLFAQGGKEALSVLAEGPVDVVVADMRMPGMDGAELLALVREKWPQAVRIVLSGYSDQESALRSVGAAHQFLTKPCDADRLVAACRSSLQLRRLMAAPELRGLLARLNHVPSLPGLYAEINRALANPRCSVHDIGNLIAMDVGLTVKLLQVVNSSFFGLGRVIASPKDAAVLIGIDLVRSLVLGTKVFSSFRGTAEDMGLLERLQQRSLRVGMLARRIAATLGLTAQAAEAAFLAGFVHELGTMLLVSNLPAEHHRSRLLAKTRAISRPDAEIQVFGVDSAAVAAALLCAWGLPDPVVEAVAYRNRPSDSPHAEVHPLTCLHLAAAFDSELTGPAEPDPALDLDYIARLGMSDAIDGLRASLIAPHEQPTHA